MLSHFISQDLSKRLIILSQHQKQKCILLSTTAITAQALNSIKEPWEANLSAPDNEHNRSLLGIRDPSWFTGSGKSNKGLSNIGNNAIDKTKGKVLKSLPQPNLNAVSSREAIDYFENSWNLTETLFSGLQGEEAFYRPPGHRLRHPMIFYYGHPACFYINKLLVSGLVKKPLDARLEGLFEVGVDEMSWDDLNKYETIWPKVKEVTAYRKGVYNTVMEVIHNSMVKKAGGDMNAKHKVTIKDPLWSLFMACEHDRIHIETSSVLIRELPLKLTIPPENFPLPHPSFFNTGSSLLPREGVDYPKNDMIKVKGGSVELGKPIDFPSFGWDNEYGTRKNDVPDFEASKLLVSNGEFYEFVVEGGYREERFWSQEGWRWRRFRNAKWPAFWVQDGPQGSHRYKLRSIFHVSEKMPWSFPVIVNLHEARAFINWKAEKENKPGLRLLTEIEQMLMRDEEYRHQQLAENWRSTGNINDPSFMMSGDDMVKDNRYNLNLAHGSENPVDEHKPNKLGFQDVNGNVWQWLEDDANPYSGFKPHPFYDDFSSPCFDAQHKMIMGGSFISTGDAGANLHSRYHFRPHFLQHSGFRYVNPLRKETFYAEGVARYLKPEEARGGQVAQTPEKPIQQKQQATVVVSKEQAIEESKRNQETYETRALTQQYLALHYGQFESVRNYVVHPGCGVPEKALMFPQRCATQIVEAAKQVNAPIGKNTRALDLGCAVGGSSFELAKTYLGGVVGIDLSNSFIDAAENVRKTGECNFSVPVEGKLESSPINVQIAKEMNLSSQDMERVTFLVGDACNVLATQGLPNPSKGYDAVFMGNLLCRLPSPRKCLDQMPTLVNPGGLLVLASPYSWLEQFTPESEWFGGKSKPKAGESVSSFDNLRKYIEENLEGGFVFVKDADQPLVIREHRRKYHFILSHFAVFQRTKGKQ